MLEKVKEYFESEYRDTVRGIERNYVWTTPQKLVDRAIVNCLAVAQFSQTIGVTFAEVNALYDEYKEKLENLLTE